jgi:hypothetical protein
MYAVEFHAPIENGVLCIPKEHQELYNIQDAQVFIIPINNTTQAKNFIPSDFFNLAHSSKSDIDKELSLVRNEWDIRS